MAYAYFWGCQIPARLPFIEKSVRLSIGRMGVEARDVAGFTCCPEKSIVLNTSTEKWLLTAARNLALAERESLDVLTPCNGCYSTLKAAQSRLRSDPAMKHHISELLAEVDLTYEGKIRVKHIIELLTDESDKVKSSITTPLSGMRVAAHSGCHMARPSKAITFDDSKKPAKPEALLRTLGATVVDYPLRLFCCGNNFNAAGEAENAMAQPRQKLLQVQEFAADALAVNCPACFLQFDTQQSLMQRRGERIHMPILYVSELLALAQGFTPEEIGLSMHRSDASAFVEKFTKRAHARTVLATEVDRALAQRCAQCAACVQDCPVHRTKSDWNPNDIMQKVARGEIDEVLASPDIWNCLECNTCSEMCSQGLGMDEVFHALKRAASAQGNMPVAVEKGMEMFESTGVLIKPMESSRRRLGLQPVSDAGAKDLRTLLSALERSDEEKRPAASGE